MEEDSQQRVTEILTELGSTGGRTSAEELFPLVYDQPWRPPRAVRSARRQSCGLGH